LNLEHKKLVALLQQAYSAEKAAAFAYQGHAGSVSNFQDKLAIRQIELDEWGHRTEVLNIMQEYGVSISNFQEIRFYLIGKLISASCYIIGWFMPFYFAGSLESGNVCEYFRMKQYFNTLGITKHDKILYDMGIKEKEHEVYFLNRINGSKLLPYFEKLFNWGSKKSFNNVDLENTLPIESSDIYCKNN
jgi:hypothetical protein